MKKQQLLENKQHGTPAFPFECFRTQTDTTDFFIPLHWHKKTELMHVHHGTCLLTIGNETYPAKGGDLFCINAEEQHRITSEYATLEYSTFIVLPDLFSFAISDQAQLLL
ncbi:MAG: AraC family ligand binding domain-containing protein, partial [Ruminococcus sp.]